MLHALRGFWANGSRLERTCYVIGAVLIASGGFHTVVLLATGGTWDGPVSFRKPITFGLSFGLTLITLTWVASFVRMSARARAVLLVAAAVASVQETVLIAVQAWRGVPSHYNLETPIDSLIARSLAVGGVVIVIVIAALAITAFRRDRIELPTMRLAIRVGFVALLVAVLSGAVMIARGVLLASTGEQELAYQVAGSLKNVHAVTMHAILVLPLLAWVLTIAGWAEHRIGRGVRLTSWLYAALATAVTVEALVRTVSGH